MLNGDFNHTREDAIERADERRDRRELADWVMNDAIDAGDDAAIYAAAAIANILNGPGAPSCLSLSADKTERSAAPGPGGSR
jgi:hypothetical protein